MLVPSAEAPFPGAGGALWVAEALSIAMGTLLPTALRQLAYFLSSQTGPSSEVTYTWLRAPVPNELGWST